MFRPQAQAETHSKPGKALRTSSPTHAETHSKPGGAPRTSPPKRELCCNFATAYFFFIFYIDYKHKHTADQAACYRAYALNV